MLTIARNKFFQKYLPLILSVILLVAGLGTYFILNKSTPKTEAAWYNSSWTYRMPLTIDHTKVSTASSTTLSNFPVLVSTTQAVWKSVANGGNVASSTGADILFTDSTGNTQIPYEREFYASSTGQLIAWVKVPTLSPSVDTTIYMYYGNSTSGLADQQQATSAWDSNFIRIYHMADAANVTMVDSTGSANGTNNAGTGSITATTGQVDGAAAYDGNGNSWTSATGPSVNSGYTSSFWIKANSAPNSTRNRVAVLGANNSDSFGFDWGSPSSPTKAGAYHQQSNGTYVSPTGVSGLSGNIWYHFAVTWNGGTLLSLYFNGSLFATTTVNSTIRGTAGSLGVGGFATNGGSNLRGSLDEYELSNTARSNDWIATEYNNQNSPSTFLSLGSQQYKIGWYNPSWQYRKMIVIDHTKVSQVNGTSLSNFPMLYSVTDSNLAYTGFGGGVASSTGGDILFTDSTGVNNIPYEREFYASSTGQLIAWVQIPSLSPTADTVIYMYYGNASNTTDQQQASSVWDSNFKGVWHLGDAGAASSLDSTSGGHTTSNSSITSTTGQIDGAASVASGGGGTVSTNTASLAAASFTIELWWNPSSITGFAGPINNRIASQAGFQLVNDTNSTSVYTPHLVIWDGTSETAQYKASSYSLAVPSASLVHYVWTYSSGSPSLYINGVPQNVTTSAVTNYPMSGFIIGKAFNSTAGILDEVKFSNTVRTADWIKTEYLNQSSPSNFYSTQSQQTVSSSATPHSGLSSRNGWYNTAWPYRTQITINHSQVSTASSTTLTNFPFLASTTSASLRSIANGGNVASNTGADILFTSSDGVTKLPHEIESYASTTGALLAWVNAPMLSPTTDTVIYMYYGNQTSGLADQSNATAVWDSNYKAVWHLGDGTSTGSGFYHDSTSNGFNMTLTNTSGLSSSTPGKIGNDMALSGATDALQTSVGLFDPSTTDYTVSAWFYVNSTASGYRGVVSQRSGAGFVGANFQSGVNRITTAPNQIISTGTTQITSGTFYYGTVTKTGNTVNLYLNGNLEASFSTTTISSSLIFRVGSSFQSSPSSGLQGQVDETRVSNAVRSADWIVTEYNNQNNPGSFETWGSQQGVTGGASAWSNAGWTSRKTLIINHEKVSGTTALSNFPVLVNTTDPDWATVANGGHMGQSDGHDIYFTSSDGITALPYERELYNSSTGNLVAWVKVPILSNTSDTVLYIYYGNSSGSLADQQSASSVWDSNYKGVWHFPNGTVLSLADSTGVNNGSAVGSPAPGSGQIDGAINLGAGNASKGVNVGNDASQNTGSDFTIEAWLNPAGLSTRGTVYSTRSNADAGSWDLEVGSQTVSGTTGCSNGTLTNTVTIGAPSRYLFVTPNNSISTNQWTHVVATKNGTGNSVQVYINGVLQGLNPLCTGATYAVVDNTANKFIGTSGSGGFYPGTIDEVRLSNSVRSADWVKTEYNNQSAPATFVYIGQRDTTQRAASTPSLKTRGNVKFR